MVETDEPKSDLNITNNVNPDDVQGQVPNNTGTDMIDPPIGPMVISYLDDLVILMDDEDEEIDFEMPDLIPAADAKPEQETNQDEE